MQRDVPDEKTHPSPIAHRGQHLALVPGADQAEGVGEHQDAHDRGGDGQHVHAGGGDVLGALGKWVQLLRGQVDDGLHGGVAQLGKDHQADADSDERPADELQLGHKAHDHRQNAGNQHDLDVALGLDRGDKALDRIAERTDEGRMVLIGTRDHGSS